MGKGVNNRKEQRQARKGQTYQEHHSNTKSRTTVTVFSRAKKKIAEDPVASMIAAGLVVTFLIYVLTRARDESESLDTLPEASSDNVIIKEVALKPRTKEIPHIPPENLRKSLKDNQATLFTGETVPTPSRAPIEATQAKDDSTINEILTATTSIESPASPTTINGPEASRSNAAISTGISPQVSKKDRIQSIAENVCSKVRASYTAYNNPSFYSIRPTKAERFEFFWDDTMTPDEVFARNNIIKHYKHELLPHWVNAEFKRLGERFTLANIDPTLTVLERSAIHDVFGTSAELRTIFQDHVRIVVEGTGITYLNGGHCMDFAKNAALRLLRAFDKEPLATKPSISIIRLEAPVSNQAYEDMHYVVGIDINVKALTPGKLFIDSGLKQGYICDAWFHQGEALLPSKDISTSSLYHMGYKVTSVTSLGKLPPLRTIVRNIIPHAKEKWPMLNDPKTLKAWEEALTTPQVAKFLEQELKKIYTEKLMVPPEIESELREVRRRMEGVIEVGDQFRRPESRTSFKASRR